MQQITPDNLGTVWINKHLHNNLLDGFRKIAVGILSVAIFFFIVICWVVVLVISLVFDYLAKFVHMYPCSEKYSNDNAVGS